MVAKQVFQSVTKRRCLNLAKIHMVAKPIDFLEPCAPCLNLAKIHMVAKQSMQIKPF